MSDKVALVTGGVGGIGAAVCKRLAGSGYRVAAADLAAAESYAVTWQRECKAGGLDILLLENDVRDVESCNALAGAVERQLGPVDVLVNCAGVTRDQVFRKMEPGQWKTVLRTNLEGVFNVTRPFIDGMVARRWGRVITIGSVNGRRGQFGQTNYCAANAGIHGFTLALAQEVAGKGVTVNTVSPGYIATPMVMAMPEEVRGKVIQQIPVGRLGKPEEVAAVVAFLASEEAGFITGADYPINGGQGMR